MGFFSAKVECAVCGKETGLNRYQLANKEWICPSCFKSCGYTMKTPIRTITSEQAKQAMYGYGPGEETKAAQSAEAFTPTKKVDAHMKVDESNRQVLFNEKTICAMCGKAIMVSRRQLASGEWICPICLENCGYTLATPTNTISLEQAKQALEESKNKAQVLAAFTPTKKVDVHMEVDENNRQVLFNTGILGGRGKGKIYNYEDILGYELLENGGTITKGGLGGAAVGGLLFGGVGAIVGGTTGAKQSRGICHSLKIKVTVNDMSNPAVFINLISGKIKTDSFTYRTLYQSAQNILSALQIICTVVESEKAAAPATQNNPHSAADEILKFKGLLDAGVITQAEFDEKKKQLLGL